jgi:glutathione S-transferase
MVLKVFVDMMSQPSRAILLFLEANGVAYERHLVHIAKLQHRSPEFTKINPSKKLPAILDGDFNLSESQVF